MVDSVRRRSNSVGAVFSGGFFSLSDDSSSIGGEFSNVVDNPLFCTDEEDDDGDNLSAYTVRSCFSKKCDSECDSRGRSVNRSFSGKKGIGRSLSRFPRQSWCESACSEIYEESNERRIISKELNEEAVSYSDECVSLSAFEDCELSASDDPPYDFLGSVAPSTAVFSDEEDYGLLQKQAFRRKSAKSVAASLFNSHPISLISNYSGLISDIRRDYIVKLEESEIRAEKLRADLVVEELRRKGLDRVLREMLPKPKTSALQRSNRRRKSKERRALSQQLSEEAMAYFDECISLSTFNSSDFSASEETMHLTFPYPPAKREFDTFEDSAPSITSRNNDRLGTTPEHHEFSFDDDDDDPTEGDVITSYVRHFEKKSIDDSGVTASYEAAEYRGSEGILTDRVFFSGGIERGGMVLCCCSDMSSFRLFCG